MDKDEKIAHMAMIQSVITRFGANSFTLKTLAMTIASALLAFMGAINNPNWIYLIAGCLPVLCTRKIHHEL
jgi:hypothetical protein